MLPLLDASLPRAPTKAQPAWLTMPEATSLPDALGAAVDLRAVVSAVSAIAETLARLDDQAIHHRDIKPSNLYELAGAWLVGDFGIATYPGKPDRTHPKRKLGPLGFLAPEMLDHPQLAAPGPADVFSLAKSLWALACNESWPPQGQIPLDDHELRLSVRTTESRASLLEHLLHRATTRKPEERPTMQDFATNLVDWLTPQTARRSPQQLDQFARRIQAARAPSDAKRAAAANRKRAMENALSGLEEHLERLSTTIAAQGLEGEVITSTGVLSEVGVAFGSGGPRSGRELRMFLDEERTDGRGPLELVVAVGVEDLGAGRVRLLAAYVVGENHLGRRTIWTTDSAVLSGTASELAGMAAVGTGLDEQLTAALTALLERAEARHPPPTLRDSVGAAVGSDGALYVLGGQYQFGGGALATLESFDRATGTWQTRASMPTARMQVRAVATEMGVLAMGGHTAAGHLATLECYDVRADRWRRLAPMSEPRSEMACVAAPDGRVYAIGGYSAASPHGVGVVEAYDPQADRWTALAPAPIARRGLAAALGPDGLIYVFGGVNPLVSESPTAAVEVFDPSTGVWTGGRAPMPTARAFLAATRGLDQLIYLVGGVGADRADSTVVEAYDSERDVWVAAAPLKWPRSNFAAVTCRDGQMIAVSGRVAETEATEVISAAP